MDITVVIPGDPVAQGRPRFSRWGTFDPPKSKAYKEWVALKARMTINKTKGFVPYEKPINVEMIAYRKIPKQWSKVKREKAVVGAILPATKPDLDNYVKAVLDGLTGVLWKDDNIIVSINAKKRYSEEPKVVLTVQEVKGYED